MRKTLETQSVNLQHGLMVYSIFNFTLLHDSSLCFSLSAQKSQFKMLNVASVLTRNAVERKKESQTHQTEGALSAAGLRHFVELKVFFIVIRRKRVGNLH